MSWFRTIELRISHMDRTEMLVAMSIAMVLGFLCMRGLSSKVN